MDAIMQAQRLGLLATAEEEDDKIVDELARIHKTFGDLVLTPEEEREHAATRLDCASVVPWEKFDDAAADTASATRLMRKRGRHPTTPAPSQPQLRRMSTPPSQVPANSPPRIKVQRRDKKIALQEERSRRDPSCKLALFYLRGEKENILP